MKVEFVVHDRGGDVSPEIWENVYPIDVQSDSPEGLNGLESVFE